ncbi:MAG: hypothetical protein Q8P50_07365 [Bacillota bacterium]|nr:hypothetical protein [Bacillota bacterium]
MTANVTATAGYPSSVDTSSIGVIGDPSLSSAERGERIVAYVVEKCPVLFVEGLDALPGTPVIDLKPVTEEELSQD